MKDKKDLHPDSKDLRQRAEKVVHEEKAVEKWPQNERPPEEMTLSECHRLIHELRVHQIELEMQNEELRRAQNRLAKSRDEYVELYDFAPVGYLTLDERGRIVAVNLAGANLLGIERARLLNYYFGQFLEPEDRRKFGKLLAKILQQQQQQQQQVHLQNGKGEWRDYLLDLNSDWSAEELQQVRITMTDITEISRVQEELRLHKEDLEGIVARRTDELLAANERLRQVNDELKAVFEASPIPIGVFDDQGRVVHANPAAEHLFGWTEAELQGHVVSTIPEAELEQSLKFLQRVLQGETIVGIELEQQKKDGSVFPASISAAPLRDQSGNFRGFIALCEDISERKRAAEALETQVRVLASMAEGVVVTDRHGQIIYTNPAFDQMFGYDRGELFNRYCAELNAYDEAVNRAVVQEMIKEIRATGVWRGEFHNRKKNGATFYTSAHLSALQINGKKLYIAVQEDITERKRIEEEIRRLASFPELNPNPVLEVDEGGNILYANPASWQAVEKLNSSEGLQAFLPPDLKKVFADAREGRSQKFGYEKKLNHKDYLINLHLPKDMKSLRLYATDITQLKQVEEALRASENRFRAFMDNNPAIAWAKDEAGRYIYFNRTFIDRFVRETDDALGKTDMELWPEFAEQYRQNDLSVIADGEAVEVIENGQNLDGSPCLYWIYKFLFTGPAGERYLGGIGVDITERRKAEEALVESEERYRSLFENNHAAMLLIEPGTANIVDANPAACTYYGYSLEELKSKKMSEINTMPLNRVKAEMKKACSGEQQQFFFQHRLVDGTIRDVEVFAGPITVHGKKLLYSIVHDITERRQAEEALRLSNQRLDLLAATASLLLVTENPQELINDLCQKVSAYLACEVYLNFLADPETGRLRLNAYAGINEEQAGRIECIDYGAGVCGASAKGGRRIEAVDIQNSPNPRTNTLKTFGLQSYACHPLLVEGNVLGTVGFGSRQRGRFSEDELTLMQVVADQVAIALERKQAQHKLAESERRYRRLVEMSPDGILVHQKARFVFINQAGLELFGAAQLEDMLGRRVLDVVHPDYHESVRDRVHRVREGQSTEIQELKILRVDGQAVDVETLAVPVEYRGKPAIQVMVRDITRRKEAEAALHDREAKLASILATAPVGIGLVQDRTLIEVNQCLCQMIGYTPEELLGKSARILYPTQEDFDFVGEEKYKQIRERNLGTVTTRWRRKDGGIIDILMSSAPLEEGNLHSGVTFTALDITELKLATEALKQERDFSAALLDTLGALVIVLDREGRIVRFNQACENYTGYTFAEVKGKYFYDIFLMTKEKPKVMKVLQKLEQGEATSHYENYWLSRSGEKHLISWSNTVLKNNDGKVSYIIGTGIDITRQRQAEEALRRARDELEERVAARTGQLRHTVDKLLLEIIERERAETSLQKSEARFAAFMKNMPGSAVMRDRAGRFLFANEPWELALGRRPGESLGKTVDDLWPPEIAEKLKALDRQVLVENRPVQAMVELPVEGETHTYLSYRFPIRNGAGEVEMIGAIGIDITERLEAEEARDRLIEILEATPDFIGSADWEGRLFYLNRAAKEMLGLGAEEDFSALHFDDTQPAWAVDQILTKGKPMYLREGFWQGESAIRRRNGREIPVSQVILAHREPEGRIKFFSTICRDITEMKQAEEKLRKSEEKLRQLTMQLLNAQEDERKRLAAELHDELGHALLTLKLHLSGVEQKLLPDQEELKEKMAQIVQYLQDTVEEVRRLYYALSPGDLEDLGLTTALQNMLEDFQEFYSNINWKMKVADIDKIFPLPVQTMIYRIMQEALTNIGKHAYPKNVKIKIKKKDRQVIFVIEDDGRGFSMDDVLEGDKRGMGLAAMAQRVSLAGGEFDIWSRENQGVRIVFNIPFTIPGEN